MPRRQAQRGVTLLEMMVVVTILAIMASISYPSISAGLETIRLNSAAESVVAFLDGALTRSDRRQIMTEIVFAPRESKLIVRSPEPGFVRELELPEGVAITRILPEPAGVEAGAARSYFLYPGGAPPRIAVEMRNRRGSGRLVRVDPVTGVPAIVPLEVVK